MSANDPSSGWSAAGMPPPPAGPTPPTRSSNGTPRVLIIVLAVMSVCCWGSFGGLIGLANSFDDGDAIPPAATSLPTVPGVSFEEANNAGYCGSGGCFSTPLLGEASDGATRAVVVDRIVRELNHDGWTVTETDRDDKGAVVATSGKGVSASFQWQPESQQDIYLPSDQYDLDRQVKVVLDWSGEDHPTPSSVISVAPGTTMGNLLIVAIALTFGTVIAIIVGVLRRRSRG